MEPRRKKPTIKDIAREAGVSATTVINALAGRDAEMAAETAERVRMKARELGYVRNLTAAALSGKGSRSFALIITKAYQPVTEAHEADINPYYGEFILRLEHEARRAGFSFSLFGGDEDDYVNFVLERNLDAAVLLGIHKPDLPRSLVQRGVPVILVDSAVHDPQSASVKTDDRRGGELAPPATCSPAAAAASAFSATSTSRPTPLPACGGSGPTSPASTPACPSPSCTGSPRSRKAGPPPRTSWRRDLMAWSPPPTTSPPAWPEASRGVRIPDDVAVIGYDNLLIARLATPPLTTIDQGMAEKVRIIVAMITNGQIGAIHHVHPTLVVRASA